MSIDAERYVVLKRLLDRVATELGPADPRDAAVEAVGQVMACLIAYLDMAAAVGVFDARRDEAMADNVRLLRFTFDDDGTRSMSGGGGGGGGRPGGGGDGIDDCDRLIFRAPIHSPQRPAIDYVAVGDVLIVDLESEPRRRVVLTDDRGQVVGTLVDHLRQLLKCLQQGRGFLAEVVMIDDPIVTVVVRPQTS